jgi:hypothetical protein
MDEHAREPERPIEPAGAAAARKVYSTPRLTRWGAVPRVTQGFDEFSGMQA